MAESGYREMRYCRTQKSSLVRTSPYRRLNKPPYTYNALVAAAILSSEGSKLPLASILCKISSWFPVFKQEDKGWKDSVRHSLSNQAMFVKQLRDPDHPEGKGNFWSVNWDLVPLNLFEVQTQSRPVDGAMYRQNLLDHLGLQHRCCGSVSPSKSNLSVQTPAHNSHVHASVTMPRTSAPPLPFSIDAILGHTRQESVIYSPIFCYTNFRVDQTVPTSTSVSPSDSVSSTRSLSPVDNTSSSSTHDCLFSHMINNQLNFNPLETLADLALMYDKI